MLSPEPTIEFFRGSDDAMALRTRRAQVRRGVSATFARVARPARSRMAVAGGFGGARHADPEVAALFESEEVRARVHERAP